ncbi:MAG TPA: restriction endonuclease subunit S [Chitinophagaceae bacterium]|nr:restriction endonuclease subunit S [Chitinophagaceae bacterium]HMU60110.1 restriction endonuclease subunit S [Chitinophagaceae bacterium]
MAELLTEQVSNTIKAKIPWIKSGELDYNTIATSGETTTEGALDNSNAKLFPAGTILVALDGATVGKLAILGFEAATNQAVAGIICLKSLSPVLCIVL